MGDVEEVMDSKRVERSVMSSSSSSFSSAALVGSGSVEAAVGSISIASVVVILDTVVS